MRLGVYISIYDEVRSCYNLCKEGGGDGNGRLFFVQGAPGDCAVDDEVLLKLLDLLRCRPSRFGLLRLLSSIDLNIIISITISRKYSPKYGITLSFAIVSHLLTPALPTPLKHKRNA